MSNKPITQFPYVDPRVSDPRALGYQRELEQRRQQSQLPKYNEPTAGGPTPPIPMLDSQHVEGQTMAQQASAQRRAPITQGSIFEPPPVGAPGQMPPPPPRVSPAGGPLNIVPSDLLPEEAQQDPMFVQGQGSMYAAAQPELARKYGVIRGNQRIPPQALVRQSPQQQGPQKLSPETIEGLKTFQQLQSQGEKAALEQGDKDAEEAAKASVAGQAAEAGSGLSKAKADVDSMLSALDMDSIPAWARARRWR